MIKVFWQQLLRKIGKILSLITELFFRVLPWSFNIFFAKILAFLWFDVFRIRRKVIYDNLDIAFPEMDKKTKQKIARKSIQSTTRSFFDVMRIPSLNFLATNFDREWIDENVIFHGKDTVPLDSGVLFLSLHLGSGDLSAAIVSSSVKPISLITKRFKNLILDEFWFSLRSQAKTKFIDPHVPSNSFEIIRALKEFRGVTFVMDQFMGQPFGVETKFFGKTTGTAYGLALFALKTKAPLIPLYTRWDDSGKLHIYFDAPVDLSPYITNDIEVNKVQITNHLNGVLEKIVSQYPESWMWLHRRWKTFE